MVAEDGIEPPTRGFSIARPDSLKAALLLGLIPATAKNAAAEPIANPLIRNGWQKGF